MFIGIYNLPTLVTFTGLFFSVGACFLSFNYPINFAIIFFMLSGICDLFDGFAARRVKMNEREKIFGTEIDSIVDAVSFGITPTIIALNILPESIVDYAILFIYVACALMRLGYFNLLVIEDTQKAPIKYYTGLPVTFSALIFPIIFLIKYFAAEEIAVMIIRMAFIMVSFLFIYNIKIPKPRGIFYLIFPLIFVGMTIVWLSIPNVLF